MMTLQKKHIMMRNTRYLATLIIGLAFMLLSITQTSAQNTSPLCFTARNGSVTVTFNIQNVTHTIQYSTNGTSWSTYTSGTGITINANSSVYFRAETDQTTATAFSSSSYLYSRFSFTTTNGGTIEASGNIMSLYGPSCPNLALTSYAFANMFFNCTLLTTAPELPATSLAYSCYSSMFDGCTALTNAPDLSATALAYGCYEYMFYNCTALASAPALPAMTLADYCYSNMFKGCTSLITASDLPATSLANNCYTSMFEGCTSLTNAPDLPATSLADGCYYYMFDGCTALTNAPALPATSLADACYFYMFSDCKALTNAPALPATTLASSCYDNMFDGCTALTTAPDLPATSLASHCYFYMFSGCTSLTTAPDLPATTLANYCYYFMFNGCTSLTNAPDLPATFLTDNCYNGMFYDCTSLKIDTTPPGKSWIIHANNTAINALDNMFLSTAGTMNGTPSVNTTYYIANIPGISSMVTTAVNDSTMGSTTGYNVYKNGTNATLTAIPNNNYRFVNWSNGATTPTITITVTCDTTLTAYFENCPQRSDDEYDIICEGESYSGYGIKDIIINQDTVLAAITKMADNCDSTTYVHITCLPTSKSYDYAVITEGESYTLHNNTYTKAGDYSDTLIAANGCDSIITLHLDVVGETAVDDANDIVISIIPNPIQAGNTALVYGDFGEVKSVEIINNFGQVVTTFHPECHPITIPAISATGIYYVRINTTDGRRYLTKLVVI